MPFPGFWLVDKFVSFLNEAKQSSCTTFFENHFESSKLGSLIQMFIRSLPVRIWPYSQKKVRKWVVAEISALQQFVNAEKYNTILVISTIFTNLIELRIIWPYGLEQNTAKSRFQSRLLSPTYQPTKQIFFSDGSVLPFTTSSGSIKAIQSE